MAYKTLTADQRKIADAWLHDVFAKAEYNVNQRPSGNTPFCSASSGYDNYLKRRCVVICDEIMNGAFTNIDGVLDELAKFHFTPDVHAEDGNFRRGTKKKADVLAQYIADFCARKKIYWDDSLRSPYELEAFKKTYLGNALELFGCYVSQPDLAPKTRNLGLGNLSGGSSTGTSYSNSGQPPKNNYKSTGPQSGNVRDLLSTPNQKETVTGKLFGIEGVNTKAQKVGAFAHIKPLSAIGASGNTNKVFLGSSNGYTDCKVYLPDIQAADAFLQKCIANCPSYVTGLHVVKKNPDSNGYFRVGTEYGPVYIAAQKLNEEVAEDSLTEATEEFFNSVLEFDQNLRKYN